MRAVTVDSPDTPPALCEDLPAPTPADNEVLVRVHASSVNPADNSIADGVLHEDPTAQAAPPRRRSSASRKQSLRPIPGVLRG